MAPRSCTLPIVQLCGSAVVRQRFTRNSSARTLTGLYPLAWAVGSMTLRTSERPMAEINAKLVNELRQRTNAPMMDAKRALVDANGDIEKAAELLRERGSASAD